MTPRQYKTLIPGQKVAKFYPDYPSDFDWEVIEKVAPSSVRMRSTADRSRVIVMPAYLLIVSG